MSITITGDSGSVTLNDPQGLIKTVSKRVETFIFADSTEELIDYGKTQDQITITGIETENAEAKMQLLNTMMDNGEIVEVSGFSDSSLNTYYHISDLRFERRPGGVGIYWYSLTLEKKFEEGMT